MLEIQHKKKLEHERDLVVKANKELFDETQRLSDKECQWAEEKATLESELVRNFVRTERQRDRKTERQKDRETDRQRNISIEI
jgi:hypothetical protein